MKATKIKMKYGSANSSSVQEIASIFLTGCDDERYYPKEVLHDYLKQNPSAIQVNIYPYPNLIPALSSNNEKYVRSEPNDTLYDNLLKLPRE